MLQIQFQTSGEVLEQSYRGGSDWSWRMSVLLLGDQAHPGSWLRASACQKHSRHSRAVHSRRELGRRGGRRLPGGDPQGRRGQGHSGGGGQVCTNTGFDWSTISMLTSHWSGDSRARRGSPSTRPQWTRRGSQSVLGRSASPSRHEGGMVCISGNFNLNVLLNEIRSALECCGTK